MTLATRQLAGRAKRFKEPAYPAHRCPLCWSVGRAWPEERCYDHQAARLDGGLLVAVPHLRALRQEAGLSQIDLANRAGLHFKTVERAENRQTGVRLATARAVARVLGVALKRLTGEEG